MTRYGQAVIQIITETERYLYSPKEESSLYLLRERGFPHWAITESDKAFVSGEVPRPLI